jgi:hypothetical protein
MDRTCEGFARQPEEEALERSTRHVTLSNTRGMITELEMGKGASAAAGRYVLRYHKSDNATDALLDISTSDSASWMGFRYRDTQWSFVKFAAKPGTVVGLS